MASEWDDFPEVAETPARALAYGPVVGEYGRAQMIGAYDNPLGPKDVALPPELLGQYPLRSQILARDRYGKPLGTFNVGDTSWIRPGVSTRNAIEFRDRDISNQPVFISPAPAASWDEFPAVELSESGGPGRPEAETKEPGSPKKEFPAVAPPMNPDPYREELEGIAKRLATSPSVKSQRDLEDIAGRLGMQTAEEPREAGPIIPKEYFPAYQLGRGAEYLAGKVPEGFPRQALEAYGGYMKGIGEATAGFTSPQNAALVPLAQGKLATGLISGIFLGQAIEGTPEQWEAFKQADSLSDKVRIATGMGFSYALPGLGALHAASGLRPGLEGIRARLREATPTETTEVLPTPEVSAEPPRVEGTPQAARFQGEVREEPPSTADLTREALDRRQELVNEAAQLGDQMNLLQEQGLPIPRVIQDRVDAINAELQAGPKAPKVEPRREVTAPTEEEFFGPEEEGGEVSATQERQQPESYQPEYPRDEEGGPSARPVRGGGDEPSGQEQKQKAEQVTGISKAAIAQERGARGLPAIERQKQIDFPTSLERANKIVANDPLAPTHLVDELAQKPRALSPEETPLIIRRVQETKAEFDAATDAVNRATTEGARERASERLDAARVQYDKSVETAQWATSRTGAGLNSLKMLVKDDYSLAHMERQVRAVVNKGKALSKEQKSVLQRIVKAEGKVAELESKEKFDSIVQEARAEARRTARAGKTEAAKAGPSWLEQQEAKARERIVARRGRLHAGYDPTAILDEAIIGAAHIKRGLNDFSKWSAQMVKDVGEHIKPYIEDLWNRAKELHSATLGKGRAGPVSTTDKIARALEADIRRIKKGTEEFRRRTAAKDISPIRPRPTPRVSKEKTAALFEREQAKKAYHEMLVQARLKEQNFGQKTGRYIGETLRLSRALKTSFDVSAVLRQGIFNVFGHPIASAKAIGPMFRAMLSERGQHAVMEEIRGRENYKNGLYKQSGLFIPEEGTSSLQKMEEVYASRLAGKIPGVAASERAYTTFLSRIRADRFDAMAKTLGKRDALTAGEARIIANFVNVTTGRGYTPAKYAGAMELMNGAFFAPRFVISRFQTLLGQPLYHGLGKGSARARTQVALEYTRTLIGAGLFLSAAATMGAKIETDPRSTDFMKLRFGKVRIDPLGGVQQVGVFLSRLLSGKTKTASGKIVSIKGQVPFGKTTAADVIFRFARTKLNPPVGAVVSGLRGADPTGRPTSWINEAIGLAAPLGPGDIASAMTAQGVPQKFALALMAAGGMGVSAYKPETTEATTRAYKRLKQRDQAIIHGDLPKAMRMTIQGF